MNKLIPMLDKQYVPHEAAMNDLRCIVENEIGDVGRIPSRECSSIMMIVISAYNYGVIAGKRIERGRRRPS